MGRIVSPFLISADGVVQRPDQGHLPYVDDEMGRVVGPGMDTQRGFLLGRRLYDEWSVHRPGQGDDVPFAAHVDEIRSATDSTCE